MPQFKEIHKIIPGFAIIRYRYGQKIWDEQHPIPVYFEDDDEDEYETELSA
jgi:hypothetical protein